MTAETSNSSCSCGCAKDHVIARRKTADGITVQIWSDGAVTCGLNTYVIRGAKTARSIRLAVRAAWLVANEVEMFDHAELRRLCVTARKAVEQPSLQDRTYLRAVMAGVTFETIRRGAVIRHASRCACASCAARREAAANRPEAERIYRTRDLANGTTSFYRIH